MDSGKTTLSEEGASKQNEGSVKSEARRKNSRSIEDILNSSEPVMVDSLDDLGDWDESGKRPDKNIMGTANEILRSPTSPEHTNATSAPEDKLEREGLLSSIDEEDEILTSSESEKFDYTTPLLEEELKKEGITELRDVSDGVLRSPAPTMFDNTTPLLKDELKKEGLSGSDDGILRSPTPSRYDNTTPRLGEDKESDDDFDGIVASTYPTPKKKSKAVTAVLIVLAIIALIIGAYLVYDNTREPDYTVNLCANINLLQEYLLM